MGCWKVFDYATMWLTWNHHNRSPNLDRERVQMPKLFYYSVKSGRANCGRFYATSTGMPHVSVPEPGVSRYAGDLLSTFCGIPLVLLTNGFKERT